VRDKLLKKGLREDEEQKSLPTDTTNACHIFDPYNLPENVVDERLVGN
jgi:hypothetical protein